MKTDNITYEMMLVSARLLDVVDRLRRKRKEAPREILLPHGESAGI